MELEIEIPDRGLHEDAPKGKQPSRTTSLAKNVRSTDPTTGRERLSQRSGTSRFFPAPTLSNLLAYTNDPSLQTEPDTGAVLWRQINGITVTGGHPDPDGGLTSFRFEDTDSDLEGAVYQDIPSTDPRLDGRQQVVASFRVARDTCTATRLILRAQGATTTSRCVFRVEWDVATNTIVNSVRTDTGPGTFDSGYELLDTQVGQVYRIWVSMTWDPDLAPTALRWEFQPQFDAFGNITNLACFGDQPQLEFGSVPTDYQENTYSPDRTLEPRAQHMAAITYSQKTVDYAEQDPVTDWKIRNPSETDTKDMVLDVWSNVYGVDSTNGVVKYNPSGDFIWRIAVPLLDPKASIDTIYVDEFGGVYAGTTGGDEGDARLYRYTQLPIDEEVDQTENRTRLEWEIPVGGSVRAITRKEELLYVLIDVDSVRRGVLAVYTAVDSTTPALAWSRIVPYPSNGFAVQDDGAILTSHQATTGDTFSSAYGFNRGVYGLTPNADPDLIGWTPDNLEGTDVEFWAWFDPASLTLEDGDGVEEWRDKLGSARRWRLPGITSSEDTTRPDAPIFVQAGHAGKPCVRITAAAGVSTRGCYLESGLKGSGTSSSSADTAEQAIPPYTNSAWCAVMAVRALDTSFGTAPQFTILSHKVGGKIKALVGNRLTKTDQVVPDFGGAISWVEETSTTGGEQGGGPDGEPLGPGATLPQEKRGFLPFHDMAIITIINDGSLSGTTRSLFRVNGYSWDRWNSRNANGSNNAWFLGFSEDGNAYGQGEFEIYEMIVFEKQDRDSNTDNTVIDHPFYPDVDGNGVPTDTDLEKVEGYMMHKFGCWRANRNFIDQDFAATNLAQPHPYASNVPINPGDIDVTPFRTEGSLVVKWDNLGTARWILPAYSGTGYGIVTRGDGVWTQGPSRDVNTADGKVLNPSGVLVGVNVRKFLDSNTGPVTTGTGTWAYALDVGDDGGDGYRSRRYRRARLAVDEFENFYWPSVYEAEAEFTFRILGSLGALRYTFQTTPVVDAIQNANAVRVPALNPDYEDDPVTLPEFAYVAMPEQGVEDDSTANRTSIRRVRLVAATPNGLAPRNTASIVVSGGHVQDFTKTTLTTPAGGQFALSPSSRFIDSTVLLGKLYMTDGISYKVYDPRLGTVQEWKATSAGEIPPRCQLIATYRGRIVVARSTGHDWAMSRIAQPNDWNLVPAVPSVDQPSSGATSRAGISPDIINAIIPYSDDLLIMGGDKEIWMLRGDPEDGGQWDLLSDTTGMAFGRSWCKSPEGAIFFMGSKGGVYAMPPGSLPQRLTQRTIERRLQNIDYNAYRVEMSWNYQEEGFHVLLVPWGDPSNPTEHYFWSQKSQGWWPDTFPLLQEPYAQLTLDGDDPEDRAFLMLGRDRVIRLWDNTATDDDGTNIESLVRIGPMTPGGRSVYRFNHLQVCLADELGGAEARWYVSDRPDIPDGPIRIQELRAGRNPRLLGSVRGQRIWLDIGSAKRNERWSLEEVYAWAFPAGRSRVIR